MKITQMYFSPGGTTKEVTACFSRILGEESQVMDILHHPITQDISFAEEELLVVGMPVFAGRIPAVCAEQLSKLKGNGAPAVALVVYGNRAYEDALLELSDCLTAAGFQVVGAGAFLARHSIFPAVAEGRPNDTDRKQIQAFARKCMQKLAEEGRPVLQVPGNRPYREAGGKASLKVAGNSACNSCGLCAKLCPVGAISKETLRKTDKDKCITCTACIYACPQKARAFRGITYKIASRAFGKKCAIPQTPEVFV